MWYFSGSILFGLSIAWIAVEIPLKVIELKSGFLKFNFRLSGKHTKFEKNLPHGFDIYLVNVKTMRKIFSNFVCFSESPNFT